MTARVTTRVCTSASGKDDDKGIREDDGKGDGKAVGKGDRARSNIYGKDGNSDSEAEWEAYMADDVMTGGYYTTYQV